MATCGRWPCMSRSVGAFLVALVGGTACSTAPQHGSMVPQPPAVPQGTVDPQSIQATVMSMADDWNTALGESVAGIESSTGITNEIRANGLWFLRNGMGASLDIAVGPNPRVAMLDLLVLSALQPWALGHSWIDHGIPAGQVAPVQLRLGSARAEMLEKAAEFLTSAQLDELDRLVSAWMEAHPGQRLVSFVRLSDFASDRNELTLDDRQRADGLLREVSEVTSALDDARLLGERALWYAARYPYVIGQQAELTSMRVSAAVMHDVAAQRDAFFAQVAAERTALLDLMERAKADVVPVLAEARQTIGSATTLADDALRIVQAIDALVARFDHPDGAERGVTTQDIKDILAGAGDSAQKFTALVAAGDALLDPDRLDGVAGNAQRWTQASIDRLLWGAAGVVMLLVIGLGLVRLIPQRVRSA